VIAQLGTREVLDTNDNTEKERQHNSAKKYESLPKFLETSIPFNSYRVF